MCISLNKNFEENCQKISKKLDTIYAQVAHYAEQEIKLNEIVAKVKSLETDNKLIKKLIVNQ